tara:strand:+ start:545 stop:796 length:252 start_codon:yes stop_codon:yes gene_type:complete
MYGTAVGSVSDSLPTPLRSLFVVNFLYINQRKAKEAMTEKNLKQTLELRIKVLEQKLSKSIPAIRVTEIRGEIIGLKWVLERL